MLNGLERFQPHAYAALRAVSGFLFIFHGTRNLVGIPARAAEAPGVVVYVAGPIEIIGGALIMLGIATRPAAFLCSGLMAAAYWIAHGTLALLPIQNGGELALLYCFVFLLLSTGGSGAYSIDQLRSGRE